MNTEAKPVKPTISMCRCNSSQIHAHGYDPITRTLALQFHRRDKDKNRIPGSIYRYANVTPAQYSEFLAAESKGTYFGATFKDAKTFPYEKQDGDDVAALHPMLPDDDETQEQAAA